MTGINIIIGRNRNIALYCVLAAAGSRIFLSGIRRSKNKILEKLDITSSKIRIDVILL